MNGLLKILMLGFLLAAAPIITVYANAYDNPTVDRESWLENLRNEALSNGISADTWQRAIGPDWEPDATIVTLDRKQPERKISFLQYRRNLVTDNIIRTAIGASQENAELFRQIENYFGVPANILVALWGIESRFGDNMGSFQVIPSLLTLAYEGRRAELFRSEALAALQMVEAGQAPADFLGSWAGATGQCQFMPSTYRRYAVSYASLTGENTTTPPDIWTNQADIFASMANFLQQLGWQRGASWGREVTATRVLSKNLIGVAVQKPISAWRQLGLLETNGQPLANEAALASVVQPDGPTGPTYLVFENYRVLMKWNRSTFFATTVGLLADEISS